MLDKITYSKLSTLSKLVAILVDL